MGQQTVRLLESPSHVRQDFVHNIEVTKGQIREWYAFELFESGIVQERVKSLAKCLSSAKIV